MGETGKQLKCKNCGGVLEFDPESQRMKCTYCGTEEEVTAADTDGNIGKNGTEMEAENGHQEEFDEIAQNEGENRGDFKVITCESCGAELLTDEYTTATFCSYCGSPTLVESRLTDEQMPDGVMPFWINREKALEAYRNWTRKGFLTPKVFKSAAVMEKISGIYVPFWLYDYETDLHAQGECVRTRFSSDSENDYTHRDYFYVCRDIEARFEKIPADASEKMEDGMMDKLEPFQYEDMRPFSMKYLSGYLSERYNMAAAALEDRVEDRVSNYMEEILDNEVMAYSEKHLIKDVKSHVQKAEYVLLPVWFLNYHYNGKNYTFAMNGQTGKIVADRPISKGKTAGVFFLTFIVMYVLIMIIGGLIG